MQNHSFQIQALRRKVTSGETRSEKWRRTQLFKLKKLVNENEDQILQALSHDLKKPPTEAFFEILALKQELKTTESGLSKWLKSKEIKVPLWLQPGKAKSIPEPLGCVLIIGAWNYPFMLTMQPLISALAAGNTAALKPSEYAPATSQLIQNLIANYFNHDEVRVFEGDGAFTENLLKEKFDHIFFTGSGEIGKKIMSSAAKTLTPVTLELGGANPAIVANGADVEITAKRIIWGKSLNSGQTCLAPNYLLVQKELSTILIKKLKKYINSFYGEMPAKSNDLGKINERQFFKVAKLLEELNNSNKVIYGGNINLLEKKISPALIKVSNLKDEIISQEIFGPLLPIITFESLTDTLQELREKPKPLAIYMFGGNAKEREDLINTTSSGGICFNDTIIQAGIPELPFGGVGASGLGKYHGEYGFNTFSHQKSILSRPFWFDLDFRYPPYKIDISLLKKLIK